MFFNKYCKILILVLLAFLSVGAVSANDSEISELISNSTDSISIDDSVNEDTVLDSPSIVSNDVPSLRSGSGNAIYVDANASTGGDGSSTNPYKDLSSALGSSADGDSIYILPGIYNGTNNVNLTISQSNLMIIGTGSGVIFDGENTNRIFNIIGSNVTIQGITFKNAKTDDNGGAIHTSQGANIINSSFENCQAYDGGAIYSPNGDLNVVGSHFVNNSAKYGGVIYSDIGDLNVVGSHFVNNSAKYYGGVIYSYSGLVNVVGSHFVNNSASYGGAISSPNVNVVGSHFVNNSAKYGGVIYSNNGVNVNVTNSSFVNNSATGDDGGAICTYSGLVNVVGSHFVNNSASYGGGAISSHNGDLNVVGSHFVNNSATGKGGAIYFHYYGGNVNVTNSSFVNNSAKYGGAIYSYIGDVNVANSSFVDTIAIVYGGAIYSNQGNVNTVNSTFINDTSSLRDGAIYSGTGNVNNSGSIFIESNLTLVVDPVNSIVSPGDQISFTVTVTNPRPKNNVTDVFVILNIPNGLTYDHFTGDNWTRNGNRFDYNGNLIPKESVNFTIVFNTTNKGVFALETIAGSNQVHNVTNINNVNVTENKTNDTNNTNNTDNSDKVNNTDDSDKVNNTDKSDKVNEISTSKSINNGGIVNTDLATGNPLVVLLACLLMILVPFRKRKH